MKRQTARYLAAALALLALLALCLAPLAMAGDYATKQELVKEAKAHIRQVDVARAKVMWDAGGTYFLDLREEREYRAGHVPGAINVPRGWLEFRIEQIVPEHDADVVLYCRSGDRSSLGTLTLGSMGYVNAVNMEGGWLAWDKADYPVQ